MRRYLAQPHWALVAVLIGGAALFIPRSKPQANAQASIEYGRTYTTNADFDEGMANNVVHSIPDQLQLDDTTTPFNFIWVAVSTKGTAVKIDTEAGRVLGEYRTAPQGQPTDPSRTTVDLGGNVWTTNRAGHSVVHIGLAENEQCMDRNGNGRIDTSTGLGDVRKWTNQDGRDTDGGVETAEDECVLHYVLVSSWGTRHVSVTENNDVWVSGTGSRVFNLIDGRTGAISSTEGPVGYGGYGGLIDRNRVIWSSRPLLRWDTSLPLAGPNGDNWDGYSHDSYGLCIDSQGNVWNTALSGNQIWKFAPDGTLMGIFGHGNEYAQGCVVDRNDDVWVAHSIVGPQNTVGHIKNDGTFIGNVLVGSGPTGVAVDARGKIWATNYYSRNVSRIDPSRGPLGPTGAPIGEVDLTTVDLGGNLYNYSDMTGSTLQGAPKNGTWEVIYDSGMAGAEWGRVDWNALVAGDGQFSVKASSSDDGVTFGPYEIVRQGLDLTIANGRFIKLNTLFQRASSGESPILYDIRVRLANEPPDCSGAAPSLGTLWPPNHEFIPITITGVTDPDGDSLGITITSIRQDEPVDTHGDGSFTPDGDGIGTPMAQVRAERAGSPEVPGNGRFYHIGFVVDDGQGGLCSGTVLTTVPHDQHHTPVDDGPLYDSTRLQ